jgi:hypothetical protein
MGREAALQVLQAKAPALVRFATDEAQGDDKAILEFTNTALASSSAASAAHQLGEGVLALDTALRQEVLARHTELVHQVARCATRPGLLAPPPGGRQLRASARSRAASSPPSTAVSSFVCPMTRPCATTACATQPALCPPCAAAWTRCSRP